MKTNMNEDIGPILREEHVIKKFDGDDQSGEPVETIILVYENGQLISRKENKHGSD